MRYQWRSPRSLADAQKDAECSAIGEALEASFLNPPWLAPAFLDGGGRGCHSGVVEHFVMPGGNPRSCGRVSPLRWSNGALRKYPVSPPLPAAPRRTCFPILGPYQIIERRLGSSQLCLPVCRRSEEGNWFVYRHKVWPLQASTTVSRFARDDRGADDHRSEIDSPQRAKWGHYATLFPLFPVPIPGQFVPEKTKTYEFFM